jgi:hypothetical protein
MIDSLKHHSFIQNATKEEENIESPHATKKRRGEQRTPLATHAEKDKPSLALSTPVSIKNMKGCHTEQTEFSVDSLESSEHNFRFESAMYDSASNALVLGGEEIHKVSEVRMGVVDHVE